MNINQRRTFLKRTLAGTVVAVAAGSGLLQPRAVLAASWPKAAFDTKSVDEALQQLFGTSARTESKDINIEAPLQAESGLSVPITVSASLANVEGIAIIIEKNPSPLAASIETSGAAPYFRTLVKMGQSSPVHVIIKSGGKLYAAKQDIKVTTGGCGG